LNRYLVDKLFMAGLPALQGSESGQVRKEAATAIYCECRGSGSPPQHCFEKAVIRILAGL